MNKILLALLCAGLSFQLSAQTITNRFSMKLQENPDGTYALQNAKKYSAIIDLSEVPDLLVPYTHRSEHVKSSMYSGVETEEFVYKTYPGYQLKLIVDKAVGDGRAPFMVYLHGGGWARGTNESNRPLSQILAKQHGIAGVRIQYTLAPQPGASILLTIEDVKDAVRFIQDNAEALNIDPSRFGFCGGSAGAHLAAVAAMSIPGTKVLVGNSGIYNLQTAAISSRATQPERIRYFLDKDPEVLRAASPVNLVPESGIPAVLLVHGTGDIVVECSQSIEFYDELLRKGARQAELRLYEFYDHNITSKTSDLQETLLLQAVEFISNNMF